MTCLRNRLQLQSSEQRLWRRSVSGTADAIARRASWCGCGQSVNGRRGRCRGERVESLAGRRIAMAGDGGRGVWAGGVGHRPLIAWIACFRCQARRVRHLFFQRGRRESSARVFGRTGRATAQGVSDSSPADIAVRRPPAFGVLDCESTGYVAVGGRPCAAPQGQLRADKSVQKPGSAQQRALSRLSDAASPDKSP